MSLPNLAVPQYSCTLPSNGSTIRFRPFLVKEKKLIMMAAEEGTFDAMYNATKQIIENCILDKIRVETLPMFDLQYLFLKIRCKSIGETSEFSIKCTNCDTVNEVSVNLDEVKVKTGLNHTDKIMLSETVGIKMKYPDITLEKDMSNNKKESEQEYDLIIKCIDYIFDGDTIYPAKDTPRQELSELLDSLSLENYNKIKDFFETIPKLEHNLEFTCKKCANLNKHVINNLVDFFE